MTTLKEMLSRLSPERYQAVIRRYEQLKEEYYAAPSQEQTEEWSQEDWIEEAQEHEKE